MTDAWSPHTRRLADVRAGHAATRRPSSLGSGYLVAPSLVLTCRHVVVDRAGGGPFTRIVVRVGHPRGPVEQRAATVLWTPGEGDDVALLRLAEPVDVPGIVRWGEPRGGRPLDYEGLGFPAHAPPPAEGERGVDQLRGVLPLLGTGPGWSEVLDQDVAVRRRSGAPREWGGVSGAAVFCRGLLVGVVFCDDHEHENRRLYALPASTFTARAGFADLLERHTGRAPVLEPVVGGPAVPESGHLLVVREFAAEGFRGRERELARMRTFGTAPEGAEPGYWRWQAPAWTGKTALMAQFVLDPPPGADVLSFFVTTTDPERSERGGFLRSMGDQLREYLGDAELECDSRARFLKALERAAERAVHQGRRLVLVVDGLDEDAGVTSGTSGHSISGLLPARPYTGLRILVTARPDPPVPSDVPDTHPLRDTAISHRLEPSPAAQVVRQEMERGLSALMDGRKDGDGEQLGQDIARLLATAGGGLSARDLAALTGAEERDVQRVLGGSAGRSFRRRPPRYPANPSPAQAPYHFAHSRLQEGALARLSTGERAECRRRVHEFVADWRTKGWPAGTPEYALTGYPHLLRALGDTDRLGELAADRARHERLWHATGSDTAALAEIDDTFRLLLDAERHDLALAVRLAYHRDLIHRRSVDVPERLVALWASLGQADRAVALAKAHPDPEQRIRRLLAVAEALLEEHDPAAREVALDAAARAATITVSSAKDQVGLLVRTAGLLARVGEGDVVGLLRRAVGIAETITRPDLQSRDFAVLHDSPLPQFDALAETVTLLVRARDACGADPFRTELAARAEVLAETAARITRTLHPSFKPGHLARAASLLARAGRPERAVELADAALARVPRDPGPCADHLALVAGVLALAGEPERAEGLCRTAADLALGVTDAVRRPEHLLLVAEAWLELAEASRTPRGRAGREQRRQASLLALEAAAVVLDERPGQQTDVLALVCDVLTRSGRAWAATRVARAMAASATKARVLLTAGHALAGSGEPRLTAALAGEAAGIVRSLAPTADTVASLAEVGRLFARAGEPRRAAEVAAEARGLARSLTDTRPSDLTLYRLVTSLCEAGLLPHAAPLARALDDPASRSTALALAADAHAQAGDLATAVVLTAEAARTTEGPAAGAASFTFFDARLDALANVARALARSGDPEHAVALAGEVLGSVDPEFGRPPEALVGVVEALAEAGRTDEALDLAAALPRSEARADALARAAAVLGRLDHPLAHRLATQAAFVVFDDIDPLGQALALGRVVRSLVGPQEQHDGSCHLAHAAIDVGLTLTGPWTDPRLIAEVCEALVRAGDTRHAVELAVDYAEAAEDETDPGNHAAALAHAAHILALAGEARSAREWATRARAAARTLRHVSEQADVLFTVVTALVEADRPVRAATLAAGIPDLDLRSIALARASRALLDKGDLRQAVQAARDIRDPDARVTALVRLAGTLADTGRHELCRTHLSEAAEHARTVTDHRRRDRLLADIAGACPDERTAHALLTEVLSSGAWDTALPAMARVAPEGLTTAAVLLAEPRSPADRHATRPS
ncbi:hypothetical protein ACFVFS_09010 [Kitasatospora sp. NPDC057692]|uniref:hypothetical protein n=1 Tax=Kitasatospora sp. NPDC057692 TaxID=3346215 RepID=UPI0036C3C7F3